MGIHGLQGEGTVRSRSQEDRRPMANREQPSLLAAVPGRGPVTFKFSIAPAPRPDRTQARSGRAALPFPRGRHPARWTGPVSSNEYRWRIPVRGRLAGLWARWAPHAGGILGRGRSGRIRQQCQCWVWASSGRDFARRIEPERIPAEVAARFRAFPADLVELAIDDALAGRRPTW